MGRKHDHDRVSRGRVSACAAIATVSASSGVASIAPIGTGTAGRTPLAAIAAVLAVAAFSAVTAIPSGAGLVEDDERIGAIRGEFRDVDVGLQGRQTVISILAIAGGIAHFSVLSIASVGAANSR